MKLLPRIRNEHDKVVDWQDYIDALAKGQIAEVPLDVFDSADILMECLQYATVNNVPVLFIPLQEEADYNPHNDPTTYGL